MAERIVSPGVFTREVDLSFLPKAVQAIGAAVVGPTVRGPAMVPTKVSTYSDFLRIFGDTFSSGSGVTMKEYKYMTSYAVQEYLRYGEVCTVVRILAGPYTAAYSNVRRRGATSAQSGSSTYAFRLHTRSEGNIMNTGINGAATYGTGSKADETTGGALTNGSRYNIRWEVGSVDTSRGTFSLYIRRGDDITRRRVILEQYSQLSLDPTDSNYIAKVVGDQTTTLRYDSSGRPFLQNSGSFLNRSRYVRVEVLRDTLNYLNSNGNVRDASLSGSLPLETSGTFAFGSDGHVAHPRRMFNAITNTNTQGLNLAIPASGSTSYLDAIEILSNADEYDINMLIMPGLVDQYANHASVITRAINMCEDRGDVFFVIDPTAFGASIGQAQIAAETRNTSYGAAYYPWIQIPDPDLSRPVWLPPSTMMPGVISFTDKVAAPWFAPAGLNRGVLDLVLQTERKLTHADRDDLYVKNVNPIATFPNEGVVVWGQKTLQKKASALDRVNVRRLLIAAKKYVASTTKYLLFENNTSETRTKFLQITEPWFEDARRRQGLYRFKIIVDDSNNTPDVIDRNELRCAIYLQPAKSIEFILVDFFITQTGARFPGDTEED